MFKNSLSSFSSKVTFMPVQLPKILKTEKELRRLERICEAREAREISSEDVNKILKNWLENKSLSLKDKKSLLFAAMDKLETYPNLNPLWNQIIADLKDSDRSSLMKAALVAFYQSYGSEKSKILGSILKDKIDIFPPKLSYELNDKQIFESSGSKNISTAILESEQPVNELKKVKLSGLFFSSKFMLESFRFVAKDMSRFGYRPDKLNRFKTVFFTKSDQGQEKFSLVSHENLYAEALLGYWDSEAPSKELKEHLKHLFLTNLRDPRAYPQRWQNVDERYQKVIKRWLTDESFEMLIQVLDAVADLGHWSDRKDFWSYYLKNEFISDSWVIFGTDAHRQAKRLQREGLLSKSAGFANFKRGSGSVQSNHSVIIMKIGSLVISEWTHSGRVRVFINSSIKAPEFYKNEYSATQIRFDGATLNGSDYFGNGAFYLNHQGYWQYQVAEFIRQHTGISHEILKKGYY